MFYYSNESHLADTATCLRCIIPFYLNRVAALSPSSSHQPIPLVAAVALNLGGWNNGGAACLLLDLELQQ